MQEAACWRAVLAAWRRQSQWQEALQGLRRMWAVPHCTGAFLIPSLILPFGHLASIFLDSLYHCLPFDV